VLDSLPTAADAPFNAYQRQHDPTCLTNTRVDLLEDIYNWANGRDERRIFWLNGLAGTGKSTIARTVARRCFEQKRLGASFFFSRGGGDVGHAAKFVTSIAWQLANYIPSLRQHICDAMKERRDIISQSLRDQWHQLVLDPILKLGEETEEGYESWHIIVVDALDECDNDDNIRIIIHLLAEVRSLKTVRIRVFMTSRPEVPIRNGFIQMPDAEHQDFILHNISQLIVNHDIRIFLEHNFKLIAKEGYLAASWPGTEIIERLVQNASGLFIWAATACHFIRQGKRFAAKRLDEISAHSSTAINAPEKHLNKIYITVLRHCISPDYTDEEAEELVSMLKSVLGSIATLLSPLSTRSLSKLLDKLQDDLFQTLDDLHAILDIPEISSHPLRLHHPSFRDFLFEQTRCEEFWVDQKQAHQVLADCCIRLMSATLRQDILGVNHPGTLVSEVKTSQIEQNLPPEVQYACLYWIEHVLRSEAQLHDRDKEDTFLKKHLLHWLEALGWMGKVSEGVHAIASLGSFTSVSMTNCHIIFC
jgi:cob(I)alamin adenosyltransferase